MKQPPKGIKTRSMKLVDVLSMISAPKGLTSILNGIQQNDYSVLPHQKGLLATILVANEQISIQKKRLDECQSDWSYWSILGDLEYWKAVRNILEGADIVGENNMPEVSFKSEAVVVMDSISEIQRFGEYVLDVCKKSNRPGADQPDK
jgi:hypothetical protein